ncbi:YfgM family protein [Thiobacter aerophilum]|uniref:Ancillary SecYEG translocon subunit n=1 Tax=Thiobacter aerophilum TaxID=3121275 RepID=A0ABV0EFV3_9BURK
MALDLQEQEQLDAVQAWWKAHGNKVVAGVLAFVLAVAAYRGWSWYEVRQRNEAARLYQVLEQAFTGGDTKKVRALAGEIMDKYARTPYALDAALLAAKANSQAGDRKSAKSQLEWVIAHARDGASRDLARLNLAALLLDDKEYDAALKTLDAPHDAAFELLFQERRGDVLAAQGKHKEAAAAYRAALARLAQDSPARAILEIKLDSLESRG